MINQRNKWSICVCPFRLPYLTVEKIEPKTKIENGIIQIKDKSSLTCHLINAQITSKQTYHYCSNIKKHKHDPDPIIGSNNTSYVQFIIIFVPFKNQIHHW